MDLEFELITPTNQQIEVLYSLLKRRIYNISHSKIPTYNIHKKFVKNHPYRYWYLVKSSEDYLGSFYLKKDNSIGFNMTHFNEDIVRKCINFIKANLTPMKQDPSMIPNYFYINVAASNIELMKVLKSLSATKIQISYKI